MKEKSMNATLYVYIPGRMKARLERLAKKKGTSLSSLSRLMVEEFLEKQEARAV